MDPQAYLDKIEEIEQQRLEALEDLAERIRVEYVIPACEKHGLGFLSGNGDFFFTRGKKIWHTADDHEDMSAAVRETLTPVFRLLNSFAGRSDMIGFFVCSVNMKRIRRERAKIANQLQSA
jgi:hypothetical protein